LHLPFPYDFSVLPASLISDVPQPVYRPFEPSGFHASGPHPEAVGLSSPLPGSGFGGLNCKTEIVHFGGLVQHRFTNRRFTMTRITASKARESLSEILNRVAVGQERIVIDRNGKDVAVVVSVGEFQALEELAEAGRKRRLAKADAKLHRRYARTFERLASE
jgi:prevent-host-death family protein